MSLNPVPTIYPGTIAKTTSSVLLSSTLFRKPPKRRIFQDEINSQHFPKLRVKEFSETNENALVHLEKRLSMHIARRPSSVLKNRGQRLFYS